MTTPSDTDTTPDITPLSQEEIDQLLAQYGIPPAAAYTPRLAPVDHNDPAVIAAATNRARIESKGKAVSQFVTSPGEVIATLFDELDTLKPTLDELEPLVKSLKDRIKAMLRQLDPRSPKIQLYRTGRKHGYELRNVPKTLCDMKKLKAEFPEAYAACTYESDQWSLYPIKG